MMLFPEMAKSKATHDPGGKVKLALKHGVTGTAEFGGKTNEYRYSLSRTWDTGRPAAMIEQSRSAAGLQRLGVMAASSWRTLSPIVAPTRNG